MNFLFGGKGSKHVLQGDMVCPKCKKKGFVYYLGGDVTHGNIYTPAADTEVEFHHICKNCKHEWVEYA